MFNMIFFVSSVSDLFGQHQYSDLTVQLNSGSIPAHKFILLARSSSWGVSNFRDVDTLDWSHFKNNAVGMLLLKWVYTDQLDSSDLECVLSLMKVANDFGLIDLVNKSESNLISSVDRKNCVKFYMTAEEISASRLKEHCSALMTTYWDNFTKEDFSCMTADILHKLLISNSKFPLHDAIRMEREDVVFLKLMEGNVRSELNKVDDKNNLPLDIALQTKQEYVAKTLVEYGTDLNAIDKDERCLLHKAVLRRETPMHLVCQTSNALSCAEKLLNAGSDINAQEHNGKTPLHICVEAKNEDVLKLILTSKSVDLERTTLNGESALWLALKSLDSDEDMYKFAEILVNAGASPNESNNFNSLLHLCAEQSKEKAGLFLCRMNANVNHVNMKGESPLQVACRTGLPLLVKELLKCKSDPLATLPASGDSTIHVAIKLDQIPCVLAIIEAIEKSTLVELLQIIDCDGLTPLAVALRTKKFDLAETLVQNGSDLNTTEMLNRFITEKNSEAAIFLLDHNAASNTTQLQPHESPLLLAVEHDQPLVVEALCKKGFDMSVVNTDGDCLLWVALQKPSTEIASILVRYGIDTDCWMIGHDGKHQTLLHRSIFEKREDIACFLIKAGCDINSPRGTQKGESDLATPLYLCADIGLMSTVICLLDQGVQANVKGPDGKTSLHIAIERQHHEIVNLLLEHPAIDLTIRDKLGYSPFAAALLHKNNKAAQLILSKYPNAAEQHNARGKNYLHESISEVNIENVMFLLSINVDVNSRTKDSKMLSPLHLAVEAKSELLVRNLLLAGANIHERTPQKWTSLHIAAAKGDANIVYVLLDNGADITAVDSEHNNALNIAVKHGNYQVCKVLLVESHINAESTNIKGQNPLHLLARYGEENSVDILNLFLECMPDYPINKADVDGNTPLLLAYINGNGDLCRALVKNNAALGAMNKDGITIFNYQVPTRQLLYRLLDHLAEEPPWVEGDVCLECGAKFSITMRKHHCRHCGRILCHSCSGKDIPIVKFNINKPVRVCGPCFDVLALGGAMI